MSVTCWSLPGFACLQAEATNGEHAKGSAFEDPAAAAEPATDGDLGLISSTGRTDDPEPPGTPSPSGEHPSQRDGDAKPAAAICAAADARAASPPSSEPPSSEPAPQPDPNELKRLAEQQVLVMLPKCKGMRGTSARGWRKLTPRT